MISTVDPSPTPTHAPTHVGRGDNSDSSSIINGIDDDTMLLSFGYAAACIVFFGILVTIRRIWRNFYIRFRPLDTSVLRVSGAKQKKSRGDIENAMHEYDTRRPVVSESAAVAGNARLSSETRSSADENFVDDLDSGDTTSRSKVDRTTEQDSVAHIAGERNLQESECMSSRPIIDNANISPFKDGVHRQVGWKLAYSERCRSLSGTDSQQTLIRAQRSRLMSTTSTVGTLPESDGLLIEQHEERVESFRDDLTDGDGLGTVEALRSFSAHLKDEALWDISSVEYSVLSESGDDSSVLSSIF